MFQENAESLRYSYRVVFVPETIGSITYIHKHLDTLRNNVVCGFNITCVGDDRAYSYLASRKGGTIADRVVKHVLRHIDSSYREYSFLDRGSDERQYCAPGVDLPLCSFMRTKYGEYPEYHTSLDNKKLMDFKGMEEAVETLTSIIHNIEMNAIWENKYPYGEPQLGKRGLFRSLSEKTREDDEMAMWWLLNYADGTNDLIDISNIIQKPLREIVPIVGKLLEAGLLEEIKEENLTQHKGQE